MLGVKNCIQKEDVYRSIILGIVFWYLLLNMNYLPKSIIWFMQFDLIRLLISTLQKLILWYENKISLGVFSFSFKKFFIWHQNNWTFGHSQKGVYWILMLCCKKTIGLIPSYNIWKVFHYLARYALDIYTESCEGLYQ